MGLGKLLTRSSPNFGSMIPNAGPTPASPQPWYPPSNVLPPTSEANALTVPAFWAGYRYVTGAVGELPVAAYRGTELVDPAPAVLSQPDPDQTPMAFWSAVAASLCLYGNAICIITGFDRLGYPTTLKPIHPLMVAVRFTGNPMAPGIGAYYAAGQLYSPDQIWHCKSHLARPGWPLGRGIIDSMSDAVTMQQALQSYAANYFINGGMPSGIIKIHRPEITQAQADDAKASWVEKYSGASTPAVLNELTDFTPMAFKPVDSQMIESRQFGLIEMALMWGLPPSKLGANIGGSTYKNAEMEEVQARNDAIAPWTHLLEQSVSLEWLPRGQHAEWDLTASLRTDTLTQYQAYQAALGGPGPQSQWLLVDEIRAQQNLDPMAIVEAEVTAQVVAAGVEVAGPELPPVPTNVPPQPGGPETATPFPAGDTLPTPPANAGPPGGK